MMKHLSILMIFCNLLIGTWAALHLYYLWKIHRHKFLQHLALYTFFLDLAIFQLLVSSYVQVNFSGFSASSSFPLLGETWTFITSLLISGMVFSLILISCDFLDKSRNRRYFPWFLGWVGAMILFYLGKNLLTAGFFQRLCVLMVDDVIDSIILLEVVVIIIMLATSKKIGTPEMRHLAKPFGYLYLSRYLGWLLLFVLPKITRPTWLLLAAAVFLYTNFVPFLWIRIFFSKYLRCGFKVQDLREKLDAMLAEYSLSQRELEILKLMLEGRNNKEIDAQLFISYHTVKNHVTSIYRKLKVKNRYQLIHLLTKKTD